MTFYEIRTSVERVSVQARSVGRTARLGSRKAVKAMMTEDIAESGYSVSPETCVTKRVRIFGRLVLDTIHAPKCTCQLPNTITRNVSYF